MILRIAPQLVGDFAKLEPVDQGNFFDPANRGWVTQDRTAPGHIGHPHLASPEKGEILFRIFSEDVTRMLQRVINWDGKAWA